MIKKIVVLVASISICYSQQVNLHVPYSCQDNDTININELKYSNFFDNDTFSNYKLIIEIDTFKVNKSKFINISILNDTNDTLQLEYAKASAGCNYMAWSTENLIFDQNLWRLPPLKVVKCRIYDHCGTYPGHSSKNASLWIGKCLLYIEYRCYIQD